MAKGKGSKSDLAVAEAGAEFGQIVRDDLADLRQDELWKELAPREDVNGEMIVTRELVIGRRRMRRLGEQMTRMVSLISSAVSLNSAKDTITRRRVSSTEAALFLTPPGVGGSNKITERAYQVWADYTDTEVSAAKDWEISAEAALGTSGTAELSAQVTPDTGDNADDQVKQTLASFAVKLVSGTASTARGILAVITPPAGVVIKPVSKDSYPPRVEVNLDSLASDGYIPNVAMYSYMQLNSDGVMTGIYIAASGGLTVEQIIRLRVGVVQPRRPEYSSYSSNSAIYVKI